MLRSAAALGGLAAAGLLAACGGGAASPTTAPKTEPKTEATKPAAKAEATKPAAGAAATKPAEAAKPAPTTAGAAKPSTGGSGQRVTVIDHDWLQPGDWYDTFIAQWEEEHPNIKVERQWFPRQEMHTKLMALAATQQIGDTVRINVAPLVSEMQIKGVLHDLDSLFANDTEWIQNDKPQFWPGNIATYTREGKIWGLPVVGHPGCVQYFYNKDMIEKAGVKLPPDDGNWTYEDLTALITATTKDENGDGRTDVYGIRPCVGNEGVVGHLRAFGGDMFDAEGKKCLINTPESKEGLRALSDQWNKAKGAYPWGPDVNDQELFFGSKVAITVRTSAAAAAWPDQIAKTQNPFEMNVAPNPLGSTGKHASQVSSDGKGVSKITQHPEEAWTVLSRLFTSQEHGLHRFLNGLGSPGSRNDVWDSDEFKAKAPKLANIAKVLVLPPAPEMAAWHHPANGRFFEADTAANNILQKVWLGEMEPDAAADEVYNAVQAIMDKGPA
jgi:multiple sugar transport system substrate-binding protein